MNPKLVEEVANAVLYEGYMLYPYRASAVKNRQRWNFGVLYPRSFAEAQSGADAWSMQTECLAENTNAGSMLTVRVRCLQSIERRSEAVPESWQEAAECEVNIPQLDLREMISKPVHRDFVFPAMSETGDDAFRTREQVEGAIDIEVADLGTGVLKIRLRVNNTGVIEAPGDLTRKRALMRSLVSAHAILSIEGGDFVSLLDPAESLREAAAQCQNSGVWPVLVGEQGQRDAMLASPIILYDYPQIAPESAGALFDGTEIDEILTLRIMTLTDAEKLEMSRGDERARRILERTESLPQEQLMKMHGALRGLRP